MHQYRVTKFNPQDRDASGAFMRDDWTSVSDIGKDIGGATLTHQRYLAVENAYIESALAFLTEGCIEALNIRDLENTGGYACSNLRLVEGHACSLLQVADIARANLRSHLWCRLEANQAYLHFGWDYYMYVGVASECPEAIAFATRVGLFVEEVASPYLER